MAYNEELIESGSSSRLRNGILFVGIAGAGLLLARRFMMMRNERSVDIESLSQRARDEFVDKCTARWVFEKTGVRLYDRLLQKCPIELRERFQQFREEEKEHEEMLEDIIRKYGADPHAKTESARITEIESQGIVQVIEKEGFEAGLDALLAAELVDNANWDLLGKLARKVGDFEAVAKFRKALLAETKHLLFIRKLVIKEADRMVEGEPELMSVH